jgi:hypothetical protein
VAAKWPTVADSAMRISTPSTNDFHDRADHARNALAFGYDLGLRPPQYCKACSHLFAFGRTRFSRISPKSDSRTEKLRPFDFAGCIAAYSSVDGKATLTRVHFYDLPTSTSTRVRLASIALFQTIPFLSADNRRHADNRAFLPNSLETMYPQHRLKDRSLPDQSG